MGKEQILNLPSCLNKESASGKEAGKDQRFNQLSQSGIPLVLYFLTWSFLSLPLFWKFFLPGLPTHESTSN